MDRRFWRIPRLWPGGTCFILGGGPSLAGIDMDRLKGRRIIAVNNAYQLGDWIDVMFFGDASWLNYGKPTHRERLLNFAGLKLTRHERCINEPGIKVVRWRYVPFGISRDPGLLTWNLSSGACAINLAVLFGAQHIILLGFDMRKVEGHCNWHADHPAPPDKDPYSRFLRPFPDIARDLERMHIECLNATPNSAIEHFPKIELTEWLEGHGE